MKLDSAVIYTNELTKSVEFYRDVIGVRFKFMQEGKFAAFKFTNGVGLSIKQKLEDREVPGHQTIIIASDDIEKDNKRLIGLNTVFYKSLENKPWGKELSVQDPDGNKVVFVQRSS